MRSVSGWLVADERELAEAWFERGGVKLVVGCFSTGLLTAASLYGLSVARLGTEMMLEKLTPFQNSNRIPVTLVDALLPDFSSLVLSGGASGSSMDEVDIGEVRALVVAVSYTMQPLLLAARRPEAAAFLANHYETHSRYFKRRRLTRLHLPGSLPPPSQPPKPTLARGLRRRLYRARAAAGHWLLVASRPW